MIHESKQKNSKFKIIDRRNFTKDINVKTGCKCDCDKKSEKNNKSVQNTTEEKNVKIKQSDPVKSIVKVTFSMFIQSLGHQTFMCLGLIPWPSSNKIKVDLQQARETIDILQILREKTKGNLDVDEDKMFENLLYELRMRFVNVQDKGKSSGK